MKSREVTLPEALRLHPKLSPKAKLLWLLIRAEFPKRHFSYEALREAAGLRQPALKSNLTELVKAGWLKHEAVDKLTAKLIQMVPDRGGRAIEIPLDLVRDHRLKPHAKWLWAVIRAHGKSSYTQQTLAQIANQHPATVSEGLKKLSTYKWLTTERQRRRNQVTLAISLNNPYEEARQGDLKELEKKIEESINGPRKVSYGQTLARLMIQHFTGVNHYIENARPADVVNPETNQRLEYDLYFPRFRVAVEFHGPQHRETTQQYPDTDELTELRKRDLIKLGLSQELGIALIVIWAADLDFQRLEELLKGRLPIEQTEKQHVTTALTEKAKTYMQPWLQMKRHA